MIGHSAFPYQTVCHSEFPLQRNKESLTLFMTIAALEGIASPDFVGIAMTTSYD